MGRLLRTHLGAISLLEGFDSRWEALLSFVTDSVLAGSREVASAGIGSLQSILMAHAGTPTMPRSLWLGWADVARHVIDMRFES